MNEAKYPFEPYVYSFISAFFFSVIPLILKIQKPAIPAIVSLHHSSIFNLIYTYPYISIKRINLSKYIPFPNAISYLVFPTNIQNLLILRGIAGFFAGFLWFSCLKYLSISEAIPIVMMNPFWVSMLAKIFLNGIFIFHIL